MSAVQRGIVKQEFAMQLWSSIGHTGVFTFFFVGIRDTQVLFHVIPLFF